jgi:hypothetical protein
MAAAASCIDVGSLKKPSIQAAGTTGTAGTGGSTGAPPPGTILLGDFEDHTAKPQDLRFANYQYYAYNPDTNLPDGAFVKSPLVAPGYVSNYALALDWKVIDVPNGKAEYPGVGVRTLVSTGFVDLSGYDRIMFSHQYTQTDDCRAVRNLAVSIGCDELSTSFWGYVHVSSDWTTSTLMFSSFTEPTYLPPSGHTLGECLALANSVVFQGQVDLSDGECASGNLSLDNIEIRPRAPNVDGGDGSTPSPGIPIVPDESGYFDGGNAAGVKGSWLSFGDWYSGSGMPAGGECPAAGFAMSQCSTIVAPLPGRPFTPDPSVRGMCTTGASAQVINDDAGAPAYMAIWGNAIGFNLNSFDGPEKYPATDGGIVALGNYDAVARGITGFAFDIEGSITRLRVEFPTEGTWNDPAYWQGATMDLSPVRQPGHYEIRWADVGGPMYLASPAAFDPTKLQSIRFHVTSDPLQATPYSYCIKNTVMLTGP